MNRRAVHKAFVEERVDGLGPHVIAYCTHTGAHACATHDMNTTEECIERALKYLGYRFLCGAEHVCE